MDQTTRSRLVRLLLLLFLLPILTVCVPMPSLPTVEARSWGRAFAFCRSFRLGLFLLLVTGVGQAGNSVHVGSLIVIPLVLFYDMCSDSINRKGGGIGETVEEVILE